MGMLDWLLTFDTVCPQPSKGEKGKRLLSQTNGKIVQRVRERKRRPTRMGTMDKLSGLHKRLFRQSKTEPCGTVGHTFDVLLSAKRFDNGLYHFSQFADIKKSSPFK
jgi:hypothetical protein